MARLAGKTAFITGAGTGIARAAALLFAQEGAKVVVAELDPATGAETAELVRQAGGDALFVQTDVTNEDSVKAAFAATAEHFGALHVLYNCAGGSIAADAPITEVDWSVYDHTLSLDLAGTMLGCRHGIPLLIAAGGGSVVNMSSSAALLGVRMHVYSAAKGAIISLTRSLAASYSRQGVRVNAICPGMVLTERVKGRFGQARGDRPSPADLIARKHPFGVGEPIDIAEIALFLASDASRMVNGTAIAADGGMSAYS